MEQEDLSSISEELKAWEMSINDIIKECQISIDMVEKASFECRAEKASNTIFKAAQEAEDGQAETELIIKDAGMVKTKTESVAEIFMKEEKLMSKDGEVVRIIMKHKRNKSPSKKKFQCDECPVQYNWYSNLSAHKTTKHKNARLGTRRNKSWEEMNRTSFRKCKLCKFSIESSYSETSVQTLMNAHIVTEHPSGKVLKCEKCDFTTFKMKNLKIHAHKMHLLKAVNILKYGKKCLECEYRTTRSWRMQVHIRKRHDKEVTFSSSESNCKFCKASALTTRETITKHMKIEHPKERLFNCDKCGYRSNWMNNIRMHNNGKHRKTEIACKKCNFESFWRTEISDHNIIVHGIYRNKTKQRRTAKPTHTRLCDLCGFQNYKDNPKRHTKRNCMASVQIDDVRTEINLLLKISSKERSAMQKIRLYKLISLAITGLNIKL